MMLTLTIIGLVIVAVILYQSQRLDLGPHDDLTAIDCPDCGGQGWTLTRPNGDEVEFIDLRNGSPKYYCPECDGTGLVWSDEDDNGL